MTAFCTLQTTDESIAKKLTKIFDQEASVVSFFNQKQKYAKYQTPQLLL
jgi:hypothetical protein